MEVFHFHEHVSWLSLRLMIRWFAKRFLHPEIVAEYNYIFLWDEDLEVENFNPQRYVYGTILKKLIR